MTYPKWFTRWRIRVWDARLRVYRAGWQEAIDAGPDRAWAEQQIDGVSRDVFYERLVTRGMIKRTKWRKRLGVRK